MGIEGRQVLEESADRAFINFFIWKREVRGMTYSLCAVLCIHSKLEVGNKEQKLRALP